MTQYLYFVLITPFISFLRVLLRHHSLCGSAEFFVVFFKRHGFLKKKYI